MAFKNEIYYKSFKDSHFAMSFSHLEMFESRLKSAQFSSMNYKWTTLETSIIKLQVETYKFTAVGQVIFWLLK